MDFLHQSKCSNILKRTLIVIGIVLIAYILMNVGYLYKVISYKISQEFFDAAVMFEGFDLVNNNIKLNTNELAIPKIGVKAPIIFIDTKEERVFQEATRKGVVHYPETASIGKSGNAFIFGHSSDFIWVDDPYRNVFALIPELEIGDMIYASDENGEIFQYTIVDTFVVNPSETWVLTQNKDESAWLTLQTSYPLGTTLKRYIVRAKIVND